MRFYGPVNPMGSYRARSVNRITFFHQKITNQPFLNQWKGENDRRKYPMIKLHERMLPTRRGRTSNLLITSRTRIQPAVSEFHLGELVHFQGRQRLNCFAPFIKGVYSKRKEFASKRSKFFTFKGDPFPEGTWCAGKRTVTKVVSLVKTVDMYQVCSISLR